METSLETVLITGAKNEMKKDNSKKAALSILTGALIVSGVVGVLLIFYFSISIHVNSAAATAQNISPKNIVIDSTNSNVLQQAINAIGGIKSLKSIRTEFISADGE